MKKRIVSLTAVLGAAALLGACICGPMSHHRRGGCPGHAGGGQQHRCCCPNCGAAEKPCEKPCPAEKPGS